MYLTFEEYQAKGGQLEQTAFLRKEKKARKLLDYWTRNRITEPDEDIKDLMFEMIESLSDGQRVTGFSNDGVSVTLADVTEEQELYKMVVAWLPHELVTIGDDYEG